MRLLGVGSLGRDVQPPNAAEEERRERELRQRRLEVARSTSAWTEIDETRLVRRGPFWVDAESDFLYSLRRGHVFERDSITIGFVDPKTPLVYFVSQAGELVFLERSTAAQTWSAAVERQVRRDAKAVRA